MGGGFASRKRLTSPPGSAAVNRHGSVTGFGRMPLSLVHETRGREDAQLQVIYAANLLLSPAMRTLRLRSSSPSWRFWCRTGSAESLVSGPSLAPQQLQIRVATCRWPLFPLQRCGDQAPRRASPALDVRQRETRTTPRHWVRQGESGGQSKPLLFGRTGMIFGAWRRG